MLLQPCWAVTQWTATGVPVSVSENASNFPAELYAQWAILQTLFQNYRQGYYLTYGNSTTLNVSSGEISAWNGSASLFLQNNAAQTATKSNLDTGSAFSNSTTYYVYAGTSSTTAATATISISLNNATPSNLTYYKQLGSFTTDSSGNITQIVDNSVVVRISSPTTSFSVNNSYLATTDGILVVNASANGGGGNGDYGCTLYVDANPIPSTQVEVFSSSSSTTQINAPMIYLVKKGYYWKTTQHTNGGCNNYSWSPLGQ